ncbi:hypothetical protein DSO57_1013824 [Entomophthora muscae]|uniref:Uncharacterized protein n=1 Tax=Entomophthora muscae TaxID=34485 RepID=A0ACC2TT23_9FUNG|nr:hypothetical protein DSO57_1013824 [Entomophthora muscae]
MQKSAILNLLGLVSNASSIAVVRRDGVSQVKLTYYWMAIESEFPAQNGQTVDLKSCSSGQTIKKVSSKYFEEVKMEGSGQLTTGQFVNCAGDGCTCFEVVEGGAKGSKDNVLKPYVSVAATGFAFGSKLLVEGLKDKSLPSGMKHNGCVRVDDTGYGLESAQIDLFVFSRKNYEALDAVLPTGQVKVQTNSQCEIKDYTKDTPSY